MLGRTGITATQHEQLLKPISKSRVKVLDGMSHLEAWDVRAHLIRIFGYGEFSVELLDYELVYEEPTKTRAGKEAFKVGYRARVELCIHATGARYVEAAFGESVMPDFKRGDAHDMAIKTAESQALKRCAINLGDQFGLSLYDDGNTHSVINHTLSAPDDYEAPEPVKPETISTEFALDWIAQINIATDLVALREIWDTLEGAGKLKISWDDSGETLGTLIAARVAEMKANG